MTTQQLDTVTGPVTVPAHLTAALDRAEEGHTEAYMTAPEIEQYDGPGSTTLYTLTRKHLLAMLEKVYGQDAPAIYEEMISSGISWDDSARYLFDQRARMAELDALEE